MDNSLRIHFNLPVGNVADILSVSWEALFLQFDQNYPRYGVEVWFNGNLVAPETIIRVQDLNVVQETQVFSGSSVRARIGDGFDNYVELRGINYNALGGGNWMGYDYVALHGYTAAGQKPYIIVQNTSDFGAGSLRGAIASAPPGASITFAPELSGQTIVITNRAIVVQRDLTIDASNLPGITIDSDDSDRIFEVGLLSVPTVILDSLTLTGGNASAQFGSSGGAILNRGNLTIANSSLVSNSASSRGGAIWNKSGTLTLENSTLSGNSAVFGGGGIYNDGGNLTVENSRLSDNSSYDGGAISNEGLLTVANCTLSDNSATGSGGGIYNFTGHLTVESATLSGNYANSGGGIDNFAGAMTVKNSTFSGNSTVLGGGIRNSSGTLNLNNTIVANNAATSAGPDIYLSSGAVNPTGVNLLSDLASSSLSASASVLVGSANLAPLGNYGGPTPTMPPQAGSPAIDAGGATTLTVDQRGFPRLSGSAVDIGAVEAQFAPPGNPPFLMNAAWSEPDDTFQFAFTNAPNADFTVLTATNLPSAPWIILGPAIQSAPGQYEFHDPGATNQAQRYYRVVSP